MEKSEYTLVPVHSQESGKDIGYGTLERRELRSVHPCRKGKGVIIKGRERYTDKDVQDERIPPPCPVAVDLVWAWPIAGEERRIPRKGKPTEERKHTLRERKDNRERVERRKKGKEKG